MTKGYKLPDEPEPSALSRFTSDTHWIFTASILGGNWLGAPWFAFNAHAVGSATKRRELVLAALLPITTMSAGLLLEWIIRRFHLPDRTLNYGIVAVFALKAALLYEVQRRQAVSVGIHRYLGRKMTSGAVLVAVGYALRSVVIHAAFGVSSWLGWAVI
jgi:hypothetical protein